MGKHGFRLACLPALSGSSAACIPEDASDSETNCLHSLPHSRLQRSLACSMAPAKLQPRLPAAITLIALCSCRSRGTIVRAAKGWQGALASTMGDRIRATAQLGPKKTYCVARAVTAWKEQNVDWAIHLGDLIDGFQPKNESAEALDMLLAQFERLQKPHWHVLANHDLYNFPREVSALSCAPKGSGLAQTELTCPA